MIKSGKNGVSRLTGFRQRLAGAAASEPTEIFMILLRAVLVLAGLALVALVAWAVFAGDFRAAGRYLTSDPWGVVTLADLYLGFLLSSLVIAAFERNWRAALWIAPIPFLGNIWTVIWFIVRFPAHMNRKLAGGGARSRRLP